MWTVKYQVYRQTGKASEGVGSPSGEPSPSATEPHFDEFELEVDPDEYVLDGVERIWAFHDRSLCFRHACHHSTCGACGMRVNGREKLSCITPIRSVTSNGGVIKVEPMRNFPVISDLVVDMTSLYTRMEAVNAPPVVPVAEAEFEHPAKDWPEEDEHVYRLADCIECGLCISACPISTTDPAYLGPAVLAGAQQNGVRNNPDLLKLVDGPNGAWRCHSVYECTEVCPSFVYPGQRIMRLRRQVVGERLRWLFQGGSRGSIWSDW
jgi:succinate dehydrogenase/fumarate reductase iron-sulfur protein